MTTTTTAAGPLLRPGEFESQLRAVADAMYERAPDPASPIMRLMEGKLDIETARAFWGDRWHLGQAYNQILLPRLMEKCPDVDARVQLFDVIASEWGRCKLVNAYPSMYRQFLLALGVPEASVPWEYDRNRPDIVAHITEFEALGWVELLVAALLGVKSVGSKVYGAIADALLAAPFGLTESDVVFFRAHNEQDGPDCDILFAMVARYARTPELQQAARKRLESFGAGKRFGAYCCAFTPIAYSFEQQPGGIPRRLVDSVPPPLRNR